MKVLRCSKLLAADKGNTSDPFIKLRLGDTVHRHKSADSQPHIQRDFEMPISEFGSTMLNVDVWDWDRGQKNDLQRLRLTWPKNLVGTGATQWVETPGVQRRSRSAGEEQKQVDHCEVSTIKHRTGWWS